MKLSEKVQALLDSDITAYRISKATGVAVSAIGATQRGERKVENMQLKTAEKLGEFWDNELANMTPEAIAFIVKEALTKIDIDYLLVTIEDMGDGLESIVAEFNLKGDDDSVRFAVYPYADEDVTRKSILQGLAYAMNDYDHEENGEYFPSYKNDGSEHDLVEPEYMGISQESANYLSSLSDKIYHLK